MTNELDELSVLDYFAAAALTGLLAKEDDDDRPYISMRAYAAAKHMMAERAKRDKDGNKLPEPN